MNFKSNNLENGWKLNGDYHILWMYLVWSLTDLCIVTKCTCLSNIKLWRKWREIRNWGWRGSWSSTGRTSCCYCNDHQMAAPFTMSPGKTTRSRTSSSQKTLKIPNKKSVPLSFYTLFSNLILLTLVKFERQATLTNQNPTQVFLKS